MADLTENVLAFCAVLRAEYRIDAGYDRAREALRAMETIGIENRDRVRYAMRLSLCASPEERARFDRAFDAFFGGGIRRGRRTRTVPHERGETAQVLTGMTALRSDENGAAASTVLTARYSATASPSRAGPLVPDAGLPEALHNAGKLLAALRLGRSRRWKANVKGERFDLRGTLRSSLHTGGDPARIRTLGHPLRNPRIALLLDGSRSMSGHAEPLLQFAYALSRRSKRVRVFVFSTALREITRDLRQLRGVPQLRDLGEAWGGGTRIGGALAQFSRDFDLRLDADTLVIIASDGLDADESAPLQRAMRHIYRRSAGVVWLNPHVHSGGFEPSARAMKAALPYVSALIDAADIQNLSTAARRLRR
jgi:uncharacterized protein